MRVVCVADTHERHAQVALPAGDLLIHAGDFTMVVEKRRIQDFATWITESAKNFRYGAVLIAGNHDLTMDVGHRGYMAGYEDMITSLPNVYYLNDSGLTLPNGMTVWGSPITPWFGNWAWNREEEDIVDHWALIPENTNILITHGPPFGILDQPGGNGGHVGCDHLRDKILGRMSKLKLHVFGHIHGGAGAVKCGNTTFVNASVVNEAYKVANEPIVIDISETEAI